MSVKDKPNRKVRYGDRLLVKEYGKQINYRVVTVYPGVITCKQLNGPGKGRLQMFDRAHMLAPTRYW